MNTVTRVLLTSLLAVTTMFLAASSASAQDVECRGFLRPGTYGVVIVPDSGFCILAYSSVTDKVEVGLGATLITLLNRIGGEVIADGARAIVMYYDTVGAGIKAVETELIVRICGVTVEAGEILVEKSLNASVEIGANNPQSPCPGNRLTEGGISLIENVIPFGRQLSVFGNQVGGELGVNLTTGPGRKRVQFNRVTDVIACEENELPFIGVPNTAAEMIGQCGGAPGGGDAAR